MFLLSFLVLLIQLFTFWIFEPFTSFVEYLLEVKFFPLLALVGFILLFSTKNIEKIK